MAREKVFDLMKRINEYLNDALLERRQEALINAGYWMKQGDDFFIAVMRHRNYPQFKKVMPANVGLDVYFADFQKLYKEIADVANHDSAVSFSDGLDLVEDFLRKYEDVARSNAKMTVRSIIKRAAKNAVEKSASKGSEDETQEFVRKNIQVASEIEESYRGYVNFGSTLLRYSLGHRPSDTLGISEDFKLAIDNAYAALDEADRAVTELMREVDKFV